MRKDHSVKYNFIMNFLLTASQFIFPLITFPYVSRVLKAEGNGRIAFVAAIANYFIMVASLGIPTYGIRACAKVRDNKRLLTKTVQELFFINLIMTSFVMIVYIICVLKIPRFADDKALFYIYGISIILNAFGMNWVYQALEQYDYITLRSVTFKLLSILLMFSLVHQQKDYFLYAEILVFSSVGSNLFNFFRLRKIIEFKYCGPYHLLMHMKPILILFAQSVTVSIYTNLDSVMLGFLKSDIEVGYYHAAVKVKLLFLSLVTSLGSVLLPRMSYYVKKNMVTEFRLYIVKSMNFELLMSFALMVYFCIFSRESVLLLAGPGYEPAIIVLVIMMVSLIPNGITGILGIQILTSLEKEKYVLFSVIGAAILDFVLNFVFIPNYGAAGAAFATTIAEFYVLVVQIYYTKQILNEIKGEIKWLQYLCFSFIAGIIAYSVKLLNLHIFPTLLVSGFLFFSIYGCCLIIKQDPLTVSIVTTMRHAKKQFRHHS